MKHIASPPQDIRFAVLAVDVAILTLHEDALLVRLIRVHRPPHFIDIPGLPGGLMTPNETAEQTAKRIVQEKAGLKADHVYLEQLYTFSDIDRDPRGRVVAVAYSAYIPWEKLSTRERENTEEVWWEKANAKGQRAYDHKQMLAVAIERLRSRIAYTTLIAKLMPREFTLTELEHAYEAILGADLDKRNFRKKFDTLQLLEDTGHMTSGERWRPAKLYRFTSSTLQTINVL